VPQRPASSFSHSSTRWPSRQRARLALWAPSRATPGSPASTQRLFDGHDHLRNITNAAEGEAKLDELAVEGIALATPDGVGEMTLRHSGPIALATDIAPGGGSARSAGTRSLLNSEERSFHNSGNSFPAWQHPMGEMKPN